MIDLMEWPGNVRIPNKRQSEQIAADKTRAFRCSCGHFWVGVLPQCPYCGGSAFEEICTGCGLSKQGCKCVPTVYARTGDIRDMADRELLVSGPPPTEAALPPDKRALLGHPPPVGLITRVDGQFPSVCVYFLDDDHMPARLKFLCGDVVLPDGRHSHTRKFVAGAVEPGLVAPRDPKPRRRPRRSRYADDLLPAAPAGMAPARNG